MKTIENGEIIEDDADNPDLEQAFWAFREALQEDATAEGFIKVWKLPLDAAGKPRSNSMQQSQLFETPIGESSISDIVARVRREYMDPGEYKCTIRLSGHRAGQRGIKFQKIISIERSRASDEKPVNNGQPDVLAILAAMQRNSDESARRTEQLMERIMLARAAQPVAPTLPVDPLAMMQQTVAMMGVFQQMMGNFGGAARVVEQPDQIAQFVKTMTAMKQVQGLLGNDKSDDDSGMLAIVRALTPLAKPALELMASNQRNAPRRVMRPAPVAAPIPARPNPAPAQPAPDMAARVAEEFSPDAPTLTGDGMQISELRKHLNDLCDYAQQNADPATVASMLLDMLPEEFDTQLSAMVTEPETFQAKIGLVCPRTNQFASWFESLRVEIEKEFEGDPDAPDADDPGANDEDDHGSDEHDEDDDHDEDDFDDDLPPPG